MNGTKPCPLSRRAALRSLAALSSGAALLPLIASAAGTAASSTGQSTSEPTGNPAVDGLLTAFEFSPMVTAKLTDSLALLNGPGGNMAVLAGPEGALLIDTGIHSTAPGVAKAAEAFAGKPVTMVVNTNWHFDHTGGNELFGRRGARLIAHENARARMSHPQVHEVFNYTFPASPAAALPTVTFPESLTLYFGEEVVHLHHVQPAHTDSDILVHFTKANVLHAGDTFFNGFYPLIDYSTLGWIGGMVAAEDRALELCDARTRIIAGHGALGTVDDLKTAREMLATVQGRIEKLLDAGKSVAEVVAAAPTADLDAKWGNGPFTAAQFTGNAAASILRHRQQVS